MNLTKGAVLINGQWYDGGGECFPVQNPSTNETLTIINFADEAQVNLAIQSAKEAFISWKKSTVKTRSELLTKIADAVEKNTEQLISIQKLNSGKPAFEAELDVTDVISTFRYYARLISSAEHNQEVPLSANEFHAKLHKAPIGVAALIVPWNFPMVTTAWKLAPALAAGCTVVLKPSEFTPLAEIALATIINEAGTPPGVVNLVCGKGETIGEQLIQHPDVSKISFTGSRKVGQHVMTIAAEKIKSVSLELGGKSSLIVLDDADINLAAELACGGAFFNAGQMCSATSRILVSKKIIHEFTAAFINKAKEFKYGPLINRQQLSRVNQYVESARTEGVLIEQISLNNSSTGFYFPLTIIYQPSQQSRVWREEIFGPVACINTFESDDEAIKLANDSEYGLVSTIVAKDRSRADTIASELEVGMVWINSPQVIFPETSWGGYKESSLGRELGPWGLSAYQEIKHIVSI